MPPTVTVTSPLVLLTTVETTFSDSDSIVISELFVATADTLPAASVCLTCIAFIMYTSAARVNVL